MSSEDVLAVKIRLVDAQRAAVEASRVDKAIKGIGRSAEKSGKQSREASGHFRLMSGAVGAFKSAAGIAGFGGLAIGIKDAVQAAVTLQSTQQSLRGVLAATGMAGTSAYEDMNKAAERLSTRGGFTTPESLKAMTQFTSLTHSASQAIQLNAAATNVARARHIDLASAVSMVARASVGQTGRLQQYLGVIQPVKTHVQELTAAHKLNVYQLQAQAKAMGPAGAMWLKQKELLAGINPLALRHAQLLDKQATAQVALNRIQKVWGSQTSVYSHSTQGALSNLRNTMEGLLAKIGMMLLPIITKLARGLVSVVDVVKKHWPEITKTVKSVVSPIVAFAKEIFHSKTAVQALIAVMAPLAALWATYRVIEAYQKALMGVKAAMVTLGLATAATKDEQWALNLSLDANPIGAAVVAVAALTAGFIFAYQHCKPFRKIVQDVFGWLKTNVPSAMHAVVAAVRSAFQWIETAAQQVWKVVGPAFKSGVHGIISIFKGAIQVFTGVWDVIKGVFTMNAGLVWKGVKSIFSGAIKMISGWIMYLSTPFRLAFAGIKAVAAPVLNWLKGVINGIVNTVLWLPKQIAKLNPFSGPVGRNSVGRANPGGGRPSYAIKRAGGGPVPGYGAGDSVPAMLTPGEFVVQRQIVNQVGMPAMHRFNQTGQMASSQPPEVIQLHHTTRLQGRVLAEEVLRYSLKRAARGAGTLSGGSLVTH